MGDKSFDDGSYIGHYLHHDRRIRILALNRRWKIELTKGNGERTSVEVPKRYAIETFGNLQTKLDHPEYFIEEVLLSVSITCPNYQTRNLIVEVTDNDRWDAINIYAPGSSIYEHRQKYKLENQEGD